MCSENTIRSIPSTPECCQLSVYKHSFATPVHSVVVHVANYMRSLVASRGDTETHKEQKIEKGNKRSSQTKKEKKEKKLQQARKAERRNTRERTAEGMEYDIMQRQKRTMKKKRNHRYNPARATEGGKEREI